MDDKPPIPLEYQFVPPKKLYVHWIGWLILIPCAATTSYDLMKTPPPPSPPIPECIIVNEQPPGPPLAPPTEP